MERMDIKKLRQETKTVNLAKKISNNKRRKLN